MLFRSIEPTHIAALRINEEMGWFLGLPRSVYHNEGISLTDLLHWDPKLVREGLIQDLFELVIVE